MITTVRYTGDRRDATLRRIMSRVLGADPEVVARVQEIVNAVRQYGDTALCAFTEKYDSVKLAPEHLRLDMEAAKTHALEIDEHLAGALRSAIANVRGFHQRQIEHSWEIQDGDGIVLGQRITPLDSVGLYIPGGSAAYPSSIIMNAIPALVAGVERIVAVTPPGTLRQNPAISYVLVQLGIDEVYTVGGAQAISALAYGTETIKPVDKIVGPGNLYVALAKKLVFGAVGIDSIAGPSEVVVLADATADPRYVAADMLSQAEHDADASAVCVTTDAGLAARVAAEIDEQLATLERREIAAKSIEQYGAIFVVDDLDKACELVNVLAPEHLEILTEHPDPVSKKIRHAGAIFFGPYSSEPVGDYFAGPNHVLPTGGTARFMSPLGVYDFVKRTSIIKYTRQRLAKTGPAIATIARAEGLTAHARAIELRLKRE